MIKGQFCRIINFVGNKVEVIPKSRENLYENSFGVTGFDSKLGALCFCLDVAKIKMEAEENEMEGGD